MVGLTVSIIKSDVESGTIVNTIEEDVNAVRVGRDFLARFDVGNFILEAFVREPHITNKDGGGGLRSGFLRHSDESTIKDVVAEAHLERNTLCLHEVRTRQSLDLIIKKITIGRVKTF